ncbi:MAG: hypothetical protein GX053_00130, partial [Tissierella sp.]|nr:hypothetical protein [Tissierella sp.]
PNIFSTKGLVYISFAFIFTSFAPRILSIAVILSALRAGSHADKSTVKNEMNTAAIKAGHAMIEICEYKPWI